MPTEQEIRKVLAMLPAGMLAAVRVEGGKVALVLEVDPAQGTQIEPWRQQAEAAVRGLAGVEAVQVVLTAERKVKPALLPERPAAPEVKHIVAIASGKGGVGKSTTAVNLALAAAARGLKVGLLDADIFGPSLPTLLGLQVTPAQDEAQMLTPLEAMGLKVMSMGLLVPPDQAMVWRGPMVQAAVRQLLSDVAWGALDVLFIDLPPGTGDVQLTLAQKARLSGAVIVSTPQDLALADVRRAVTMFEKVGVPVLGMIENMRTFICPHCGEASDIFGHGGAEAEAKRLGLPFLGAVPLDIRLREASDAGVPLFLAAGDSTIAQTYTDIFLKVSDALSLSLLG